ncbi:MAG: FtsX-like permease family protein [Planctomycetes bacterium]|nr:FtsX-like permease family protein [Planctomycetota bacterium]
MFVYTLLNLIKSPLRLLQLILSTFIVFSLILGAMAFEGSLSQSLSISGDDKNVILIGAGSEESLERSEIPLAAFAAAKTIPGLKRVFAQSAASPEVHFNSVIHIEDRDVEMLLRGVQAESLHVYPKLRITVGHFPHSGQIMLGKSSLNRLGLEDNSLQVGDKLIIEKQTFTISAFFEQAGSVMNSEIWMNLGDLNAITRRDTLSAIVLRLDQAEYDDIDLFTKQRLDLQLSALRESTYYNKLETFYQPILWMVWVSALLIAAGALFGGMNTFYAYGESRMKELATLQAIGFSRQALFASMWGESIIIHLFAFQLAAGLSLYFLPAISLSFGSTYFALQLSQEQLWIGLGLAIGLASCVIIPPAWHCLSPPLNSTLRS